MRLFICLVLLWLVLPSGFLLADSTPRVLFDQGHGQVFTIEKKGPLHLGTFAEQFRLAGWQVAATGETLTAGVLADVDALVVSGAFTPFSPDELKLVEGFLKRGGRLAVMLHIPQPLTHLLGKLGVTYANGVLLEGDAARTIDGSPGDFNVSNFTGHPLTQGLGSLAVYGCWPLKPIRANAQTLASTSPTAWIDLNRDQQFSAGEPRQPFGVLVTGKVGLREYVIFGDDAIFQNRFLAGENEKIADNLRRWMFPMTTRQGVDI